MAETIKVLAQSNPSATTLTDMYTVPGSTTAVISTLCICNRTAATRTVRVSIAIGGASDSLEQYIYYDVKVLKNDSTFATIGITLAATDVMRVYTDAIGVSFSIFGTEIT